MIKIRRSVFETNSSSMHSLAVVKNPKPYSDRELRFGLYCDDKDKEFNLVWSYSDGGEELEFGRHPFQVLRDPLDKLRYCVAHELGSCEKMEELPRIQALVSKYTGIPANKVNLHATKRKWRTNEEYKYYGYIEHNDTGESPFEYLTRKGIELEEFIMNPKYVVICDGDEYCDFKALFKSNILNGDNLEDISSGVDFWTETQYTLHLDYLDGRWGKDESPENLVDGVNEFIKVLVIYINGDNYKLYSKHLDRLKAACELARKKNPNIQIVLKNDYFYTEKKVTPKQLKSLDTSFIDKVDIDFKK